MRNRWMGALVASGLLLQSSVDGRAEDDPIQPLPQFEVGEVLTASQLNAIVDRVNAIMAAVDSGSTVVTSEVAQSTAAGKFASVNCPPGINGEQMILTGGGASVTGSAAGVALNQSAPTDLGSSGWSAQAERNSGGAFNPSSTWGLQVYAVCVEAPDFGDEP